MAVAEAEVTINGLALTERQSAALRISLVCTRDGLLRSRDAKDVALLYRIDQLLEVIGRTPVRA
ncbi:hypothetical protein [Bradyrhizobium sp. 2S1]|uniref:hypothetical protein n=1 Tax=Bradyrhizobium sp. 2S1 TaxID=1404429 RepID=UPI0014082FBC|nr:hypothetical protein [Bradyrhizobium sp. 2S1]MCK7669100.1 hypothetical protein [Bradyrhizobium sp. 2S1]MCK7671504.1 hypothetical protein [Bradyrhizobium sp. 2S1]